MEKLMKNFEQFGIALPILNNIKRMGFETPTPIQEKALPIVLQGKDVIGIAETGKV